MATDNTTSSTSSPKNKKRAQRAFYSLLVISLTASVICAGGLIRELYIQNQSRNYYENLLAELTPSPITSPAGEQGASDSQAWLSNQNDPDKTGGYRPAPPPDLAAIQAKLPNIQAWIRGEGAGIDYPVVQGENNDYYLEHLPNSTRNKMGSIFLDYRNAADFSDQNSLIYGHHIKQGALFGALDKYKSQGFYNAHPTMLLYTPEQNYTVELIAGYVADASKENLPLSFADEEAFKRYIKEIQRRSLFTSTVEISAEDRLLSLCTCSYELSDGRFILVGKLVAQ